MKNTFYIILLTFTAVFLSACEKMIELDLKNTKPVVVIEASVNDDFEQQVVIVTQTKPFTDDNTVVPIANAVITLNDVTDNKSYTFGPADSKGTYLSTSFRGKPGNTYELSVRANNQTYTAKSTMPKKVLLDSISVTEVTFFGETNKFIKVNYADPAQFENQYRYLLTINQKPIKGYFVDSDRFNNGKYVSNTLFTSDTDLKSGDEIKIEFQCVDMNVYRYLFAIAQISGNGGPPTAPSNPDSNFSNGALGFFNAHTNETKLATIK